MHLRTATLASVTVFRLCLSSNTYLVVKSRQRLQSNLWRKEDEQSSSFSAHQSRVSTQNVYSHSQVYGLPSRAYYTTTSTRKVVLRQHKEVYGTYRAVKTAPASMLRVWASVLALAAHSNGHTSAGQWILGDKMHWKCATFGGEHNHDFSFI